MGTRPLGCKGKCDLVDGRHRTAIYLLLICLSSPECEIRDDLIHVGTAQFVDWASRWRPRPESRRCGVRQTFLDIIDKYFFQRRKK